MSNIAIQGAATGTGVFTLTSPATNTDRTLTLPDEAGTVLTDRVIGVNASAPDDSVVVDASGNVGIGTSSPQRKIHVAGWPASVGAYQSIFEGGVGGYGAGVSFQSPLTGGSLAEMARITADGEAPWDTTVANQDAGLRFYTALNGTVSEKMRIDPSGSLLVGATSSAGNFKVQSVNTSSSGNAMWLQNSSGNDRGILIMRHDTATGGTTGNMVTFQNASGSNVGAITSSNTATTYATSSDYRLKEDWVAVADASTRVNALKPVNFAWKVDGKRVDGFLAHELAEVVPEAVTGEKDAVELVDIKDEGGNVTGQEERQVYQGIDQSKLVPLLTAALQEALAKIDDLTARVVALEGQP